MSSVQTRTRGDGSTAYRVMFRIGSQLVGETFDAPGKAEGFRKLVDRIGGQAARDILRSRNDDYAGAIILETWLTDHIERLTGVTDGTRKGYRSMARDHINPSLGQYPVEAVGRRQIEKWVNTLTPNLSGKTLRNVHALLSASLERAVREELIPANPAKGVRLPTPDHNRVEMVTLTQNEITVLVDAFPLRWQSLVATMAGTGMRFGEITALPVGACSLDDSPATVRVQQSWKHTGLSKRTLGPPKTKKGRRVIPISRQLAEELRPLIEGRPADALVFLGPQGGVVDHAHFYERVWIPSVKKSGLTKQPRIHDLRHTYGTYMAARLPLDQVQRLMGHESIETTVGTYGHARPGDADSAAHAVAELLGGVLPEVEPGDGGPQELPAALPVAGLVARVEGLDDAGAVTGKAASNGPDRGDDDQR